MPSNKRSKNVVQRACDASPNTLLTHLPLSFTPSPSLSPPSPALQLSLPTPPRTYTISLLPGPQVPAQLRSSIWRLYEGNMRGLAEGSSMGWDVKEKGRELWHKDSRFILLRRLHDYQEGAGGQGKGKGKEREAGREGRGEAELAGFAMFRFDWEECMDEDWQLEGKGEECEVLYCYELQIAPEARRLGLGKFLVDQLVLLAREWRMRKVMLTCLKANTSALSFYASQGFSIDLISPSRVKRAAPSIAGETLAETEWADAEEEGEEEEEECDYEILSRRVFHLSARQLRSVDSRSTRSERPMRKDVGNPAPSPWREGWEGLGLERPEWMDEDLVVKACLVGLAVCASVVLGRALQV